jgi:hypothetical protein
MQELPSRSQVIDLKANNPTVAVHRSMPEAAQGQGILFFFVIPDKTVSATLMIVD